MRKPISSFVTMRRSLANCGGDGGWMAALDVGRSRAMIELPDAHPDT
jgi:hypothetical protein